MGRFGNYKLAAEADTHMAPRVYGAFLRRCLAPCIPAPFFNGLLLKIRAWWRDSIRVHPHWGRPGTASELSADITSAQYN